MMSIPSKAGRASALELQPGPGRPWKVRKPPDLLEHWQHRLADPGLPPARIQEAAFGPFTIEAGFHGFTAGSAYGHALRPARARGQPPALAIHVLDGAACGLPRPRLAWGPADFGPKRIVPGWSDRTRTTYLLRSEGGVAIADWTERRAVIWLPSALSVPWYERAAPFRWLLDNLAARLEMTTLHAAVVGRDGAGVLLAGRGRCRKVDPGARLRRRRASTM